MSNIPKPTFEKIVKAWTEMYRGLPNLVGGVVVAFFKEGFRRQGWLMNGRLQRWRPRKRGAARNKGRSLLIDSGALRRSVRVLAKNSRTVEVGSDLSYAKAHNEGGKVKGTATVKQHTRRAHNRGTQSVRAHSVREHRRAVDYNMPQRQFIGYSPDALKRVERQVLKVMKEKFNHIK